MPTIDDLKEVRQEKLAKLKALGVDPYPSVVRRDQTVQEARAMDGAHVAVVGRITGMRGHGKIMFLDLRDESDTVQVVCKVDAMEKAAFTLLAYVDIGDFLAVSGKVGKTEAGEVSVFAQNLQLISKSIRPLPSEWHGLKDIEERYRQRYVDLNVNQKVREVFYTRAKVISYLRRFLDTHGFLEVETPVLQPLYGGAQAKPFTTHHNALDVDMFLRIADELYLKRLIVGGFDKVYEMSKDFRNEGIDRSHNPEFTMLEFYWAYANYEILMKFTEEMLSSLAQEILGKKTFTYEGTEYDLTPPWPRKTYRDVVLEFTGIDIDKANTEAKLLGEIKKKNIKLDLSGVVGYGAILDTLYKATARPHLAGPMFLTDRPTAFVALAKRLPNDPLKTASFQLLIAGKEVLNAYNELNDPEDQEARWKESETLGEKGQDEHEVVDRDYIRALEYGMPPTAGWGMGIDRLVSLLTDQPSLKDVILFPTLRPETLEVKVEQKVKVTTVASAEALSPSNISKELAKELLHEHTQNENLRRHMYAVGAVMRALAQKLGGNPDTWETLGLLHDADWEETKDTPDEHTKHTLEWLKKRGITDGVIVHAIMSHNSKRTNLAELDGVMEWALETCDELTGFITAVTLMRPDKLLSSVTVDSVLKKWGKKEFARAVDRAQIEQCKEKLGMELSDFISIALSAMQSIHESLGL
jgi:lysyl-tRNA synthetase, class II